MSPHPLDQAFRDDLHRTITEQIEAHRAQLAEIDPDADELAQAIASLLRGGKRLRAGFLHWGHLAAGGSAGPATTRAASAMEFFQAAALIHDDVMDDSDTRRGAPAAHRAWADRHRSSGLEGSPEEHGRAGAILAGDLCLVWADTAFTGCGWDPATLERARPTWDLMRTQLMGGQFLDILNAARPWEHESTAERDARVLRVMQYKSAKYSIEHPLLIGADAAGVDPATRELLSDYGLHLGVAFQLRDDVLGVFGDPEATGKPSGDDLREGKRTALVVGALDAAAPADAERFSALLGSPALSPEEIGWMRGLLQSSGAVDRVEGQIDHHLTRALSALEQAGPTLEPTAVRALVDLAHLTTQRAA
ncbi:geranylgeranyl diphosphate synthase, type I [Kytococcus aerolatus]|uniref:Geranylgeranyl diphosphate synthase, type I n=1 Tax=Kytococcus aerolatus TaxID=592308 RepID=A0A212T3Q9_9MICO|nr:polyprenyl synthetase family protein [Kytococcus aerolatus]SNC60678.1 geranylgeranyl diphosphate synthase, type I [Kytococcus aerolatus]